jgi:hypothetical protein
MHKKLTKYIEHYDVVQNCCTYILSPNGGMVVLVNEGLGCEICVGDDVYSLGKSQAVLLNAYEEPITIQSQYDLNLMAVRFRGAGASFFYEEYLDVLMQAPHEPVYIVVDMVENTLDTYMLNRLMPSKLPFNIMKIIDLLDEQGSDYSIDEILAIANVPRKILDKMFNLRTGLTFKAYAGLKEVDNE